MALQNPNKRRKRVSYVIAFIILLAVEVFIALFVDDKFIRPYIGDVLVVIVIYMAVRVVIPEGFKLLPLYIFLFATIVECLQYFNIVEILGVSENTFLRVLIGSVFDIKDILCYGIGCIVLALIIGIKKGNKLL